MSWRDLARKGDYGAALTAVAEEFRGRETSLEATFRFAEVHEQWGDSEFFFGGAGGPKHYHHAMRLLFPPGLMFDDAQEHGRRMEAYSRMSDKIRSVNGAGFARDQDLPGAKPHPDFRIPADREAEIRAIADRLAAERAAEEQASAARQRPFWELPAEPEPAPEERGAPADRDALPAAASAARSEARLFASELARAFGGGHWAEYAVAEAFAKGGYALASLSDEMAAVAYDWSLEFYTRYQRSWTAHLPASRWDSDGGSEMAAVEQRRAALTPVSKTLPPWIRWLLAGNLTRACAALPDERPADDFTPFLSLLAQALVGGGKPEVYARLQQWLN